MNLGVGDRRALANLIAQAIVGKVYQNEHELTNEIAKLLDEFFGPNSKHNLDDYSLGGIGGAFEKV